ncbi:relaxin receptor 1-like [Babylonia areolata]|uniref:relaxin receptor 1-like n=1 Tax=Babylonia areolata TaxID=304850 RepID=UPI003FCF42F5
MHRTADRLVRSVHLTKAFDTVNREALWTILTKPTQVRHLDTVLPSLCDGAEREVVPILLPSQCPMGTFECETSRRCIDMTLMCDNVTDCDDRSDEGSKDLSGNDIHVIRATDLGNLVHLNKLHLTHNELSRVPGKAFGPGNVLTLLSLQSNNISYIDHDAFSNMPLLRDLQLENNGIQTIDTLAFQPLTTVHSVYFDKFYLCVYAQHAVECDPQGDGISSRHNLLENLLLRVFVWLVALLACLGNVLVFLGRVLLREDNQTHSFFIKNLSLADMLMGVYLLVIGAQDLRFRGEYLLHDEAWRNSLECDVCGVLSTLSTEMSVLTLCIITLDRYLSITYPLSFRKRGLKAAYGVMGLTWSLCLTLALLPVLGFRYFGASFYRDNGVCVPLHLHDPKARGWEYSSFLFLGINLASFAFIAYAYGAMFWSIHRSAIPLRTSRESKERCLVKRFFFIVITDFLCWIPIIIIKLIALSGVSVSKDLYAWVIVFILPVNSALNPLLYTLTTKLFKQTLLSKFTAVVFRPTSVVKGGGGGVGGGGDTLSSRASMRTNASSSTAATHHHHPASHYWSMVRGPSPCPSRGLDLERNFSGSGQFADV